MNVLSVDPGLSGAVCLFGPGTLRVRRDFKKWEDIAVAITELSPCADVAVIELVHSMPGQGVASMFSFGMSAGVALGALRTMGFSITDLNRKPLIEVTPQRWQNYFWGLLGTEKSAQKNFDAKAVAARFVPASVQFLARAKDHNTADAVLMAVWRQCNLADTTSVRGKRKKKRA